MLQIIEIISREDNKQFNLYGKMLHIAEVRRNKFINRVNKTKYAPLML